MNAQQKKLSLKYYLYKLFTNLWFYAAVWLYFYRIFITDQELGMLDSIAFAIGLFIEVPSGALADKFGRDRLVKIGLILAGSGMILQAFGTNLLQFIALQSIMMVGYSFISGADDALFYSSFKFKKSSKQWQRLVTRGSQIALIGTLLATVLGGSIHSIDYRVPWILTGISFIIATLIIWNIPDTRPKSKRGSIKEELSDYIKDISKGFYFFRKKELWFYVPFIIVIQGLLFTTSAGILRLILLDRFNFSPFEGAIVIAVSSLVTVGLLSAMHKYADKISERKLLSSIGLIVVFGLLASIFNIGVFGGLIILSFYTSEYLLSPIISELLNKKTEDRNRATVLSVASFLKVLPYVVLAPVIGYLNTNSQLEYFLIGWAGFSVIAIIIYAVSIKKDIAVAIE